MSHQKRMEVQKDEYDLLKYNQTHNPESIEMISCNVLKSKKIQKLEENMYYIGLCRLVKVLSLRGIPEGAKTHKQVDGTYAYEDWQDKKFHISEYRHLKQSDYFSQFEQVKIYHNPEVAPPKKTTKQPTENK